MRQDRRGLGVCLVVSSAATRRAPSIRPAAATTFPPSSSFPSRACRCCGAARPRGRRSVLRCWRAARITPTPSSQATGSPPPRYYPRAGRSNAARRDGMGTALLVAVEQARRIPDHYFQAVGSGTGAIAAWEMNLRLLEDGRFGDTKMRLHLGQNAPFTPMTDAWEAGSRTLAPMPEARERVRGSARRCWATGLPRTRSSEDCSTPCRSRGWSPGENTEARSAGSSSSNARASTSIRRPRSPWPPSSRPRAGEEYARGTRWP